MGQSRRHSEGEDGNTGNGQHCAQAACLQYPVRVNNMWRVITDSGYLFFTYLFVCISLYFCLFSCSVADYKQTKKHAARSRPSLPVVFISESKYFAPIWSVITVSFFLKKKRERTPPLPLSTTYVECLRLDRVHKSHHQSGDDAIKRKQK